jgi:hypothetical protein
MLMKPTRPTVDADVAPVLSELLERAPQPARPCESLAAWWPRFRDQRQAWAAPIDQALVGGVSSDRIGYAFAAGYQSALRVLDPQLPVERPACFSVTEEGGAHPRAVRSTLLEVPGSAPLRYRLNGDKKWATLAGPESMALIVASVGVRPDGQNQLRVGRVPLAAEGARIVPMPPTPFAPEIPHCRLELRDVEVAEVDLLPGDGYADYVRPFRTIEDLHVTAAILAYLFAVAARSHWPAELRERLLATIVAVRALAASSPAAPATHVALAGLFGLRDDMLAAALPHWESVDAEERARWHRDAPLASIASGARAQRTARAWDRFAPGHRTAEGQAPT